MRLLTKSLRYKHAMDRSIPAHAPYRRREAPLSCRVSRERQKFLPVAAMHPRLPVVDCYVKFSFSGKLTLSFSCISRQWKSRS